MIELKQIQSLIEKEIPNSEVTVEDMTGGGDHFQVIVLSSSFKGKTIIEQHKMVHASLEVLKDQIHALVIKTISGTISGTKREDNAKYHRSD